MAACLCCGAGAEVGVLCRKCARDVPPCEGLIADHVRSNVAATDAEAWLVDGFGVAHGIAPKTTIGRSQDGQIVILSASVSREHAELKQADTAWTIRDLGSRNGTFVGGTRAQGRVNLPARSVVKIGDVPLWFLAEVHEEPSRPTTPETMSMARGLVRFLIDHGDKELCVLGSTAADVGGTLLWRTRGDTAWSPNRELPKLEFQLLRTLCARAHEEADSPAQVRGCVSTKQLAKDLPFQSKYANEENVRQVVRRLRGALEELGADSALAVVPGRGYYIAGKVSVSSRD